MKHMEMRDESPAVVTATEFSPAAPALLPP
jgi:hypothetical protein